ncbi:GIN domain-containing protein [Bacteroides mediterraneensis]|uniref:GIN domain-containing protein n=1 Tax=Bacteroides mediterraneensis TaxID=1841856 RepID=UPI001958E022|nr:DUF2807 domain-containing protein [Bacteroides mediterraneensis]MBM6782365.1 DUF2807 domain-containing protein [Bacteroides mediterraneensis]
MKKIASIFVGLIMIFLCATCISAKGSSEDKVSETRSVSAFHSIEVESVASVYFTQSNTYSLRVEGEKRWVNQTKCTVKDGVLLITWAEKGQKTTKNVNGLSIYVSAPDLQEVTFEGVGSFNCKSRLNLKDVKFDVQGVGSLKVADLHARNVKIDLEGVGSGELTVDCDQLDASVEGVGSLTLSGKARSAHISKDGIGSVSTRRLKVGE